MVKSYKITSDSIKKIKETAQEFKFSKLSDFVSFLYTVKVEDGDKFIINSDIVLDMKEINHENDIDFIFDMEMEINSGYKFEIANASTKDNNIQYFQIAKPLTIYGILELGHLTCNNSQITISKKGTLLNKAILHNGYGNDSEALIINNGRIFNERVIHNNSKIINNLEFKHGDFPYVSTFNNKIFENNGTITITAGEFINSYKDPEIIKKEKDLQEEKQDEKPNKDEKQEQEENQEIQKENQQEELSKLDDSLNEIKEEKDIQDDLKEDEQKELLIENKTIHEILNDYSIVNTQVPLTLSTLSESTVNQIVKFGTLINQGTIEIDNGILKSSGEFKLKDSVLTITKGSFELVEGISYSSNSKIELKDGKILLSKGDLELKDKSSLLIEGGEFTMITASLSLYDSCAFDVKGGSVVLNNFFNILGGSISFNQGKFDTKDRKIILTSFVNDDSLNIEDRLKFIIESDTIENNVKSVIDDRYILKTELEKQLQDLSDKKQNEIDTIKTEFLAKMELKEKEYKKQFDLLKEKKTIETTKEIEVVKEVPIVPKFASGMYNLSFVYDEDTKTLKPVLESSKVQDKLTDDVITSEASDLVNEILGVMPFEKESKVQKLKDKISSEKYSKIFLKSMDMLKDKIKSGYLQTSLVNQTETNKVFKNTYAKTLNDDLTTSVEKVKIKTRENKILDDSQRQKLMENRLTRLKRMKNNKQISEQSTKKETSNSSIDIKKTFDSINTVYTKSQTLETSTKKTFTSQPSIKKRKVLTNESNINTQQQQHQQIIRRKRLV